MSKTDRIIFDTRRLYKKTQTEATELINRAYTGGIDFFDVSPHFGRGMCEELFINAKTQLSVNVRISAKNGKIASADDNKEEFMEKFQNDIARFSVSDFYIYTVYDINSFDRWNDLKRYNAVYEACVELKKSGKIRHLAIRSCLKADELLYLFDEYTEVDTLITPAFWLDEKKYCDIISLCKSRGIRVFVSENAFSDVISKYPEITDSLKCSTLTTELKYAKYLCDNTDGVFCQFDNEKQLADFLSAVETDEKITAENRKICPETLCTGCGLCLLCLIKSPVTMLMAVYNEYIVTNDTEKMIELAKKKFGESEYLYNTRKCIGCRLCEQVCPQGIKISERIEFIKNEAHK